MGPSAWKSTLLYNVRDGSPRLGKVWLGDVEITKGCPRTTRRGCGLHRMGFVLPADNMMAKLGICWTIFLVSRGAGPTGSRGRKIEQKGMNLPAQSSWRSRRSGLDSAQSPRCLGGQLQRACICRSMMKRAGNPVWTNQLGTEQEREGGVSWRNYQAETGRNHNFLMVTMTAGCQQLRSDSLYLPGRTDLRRTELANQQPKRRSGGGKGGAVAHGRLM